MHGVCTMRSNDVDSGILQINQAWVSGISDGQQNISCTKADENYGDNAH